MSCKTESDLRKELAAYLKKEVALDELEESVALAAAESATPGPETPLSRLLDDADLLFLNFRDGAMTEEQLDEGLAALLRFMETTNVRCSGIVEQTAAEAKTIQDLVTINLQVDREASVRIPA